ncbi:MAG TPA: c-type cytochrome domain-containing protein [Pirellulaceae bacterium]|jgi:WD40 repeat protein|nr:c-type cytochrome domain-containing protein [Pirellulaceae bacterium]
MMQFSRRVRSLARRLPYSATRAISLPALLLVLPLLMTGALTADEPGLPVVPPAADVQVDFGKHVLPLLKTHCVACHSASLNEGDLSMESAEAILAGGASGPAVVAGQAGESLLFRLASHREEPVMPPAENDANATNLPPEALGLLKAWIDQGAKKGDASTGGAVEWHALDPSYGPIFAADISADGRYAAAARGDRVLLFDLASKREIGRLADPALAESELYRGARVADLDAIQSLAFSRDGQRIATGGFRTVRIWKREEGALVRMFATEQVPVHAVDFSADRALAAIVGEDGSLRLFDLRTNSAHAAFGTKAIDVACAAFSLDGTKVFAGTSDGGIFFSVADGVEIARLASASPLSVACFAADGASLVTGGADGVLRVYASADLSTNSTPIELTGHQGPIVAIASLPADANAVVSGGIDGTARVWNLSAKSQTRQVDHGAPLTSVATSPDGTILATAGVDGSAIFWNVQTGDRVSQVSREAEGKLREAELRHAVEVAKLRERTAKADLDAALKRERDESAVADAAELLAAENRLAAKRKTTDAEKPITERDAAEKAFTEYQAALDAALAAKTSAETAKAAAVEAHATARTQREAGTVDDAALKAAEEGEKAAIEAEKLAVAAVAEATKKRDEAKREADRLRTIAQKAIDERTVAEGGAQSAAREAGVAREIAAATLVGLPAAEGDWSRRVEERRAREAELATFLASAEARTERLRERTASLASALREAATIRQRALAAPEQPGEPSAEVAAAKAKADADLQAAGVALEERLQAVWEAADDKLASVDVGTAAKRAADEALARANELVQAATVRKEAADKALADAQAKLAAATTDDDKELRQLAVTIAQRNATSAAEAIKQATDVKSAADAKKAEANTSAEATNAEKARLLDEAIAALAAAKTAYAPARSAAVAAGEAAHGPAGALAAVEPAVASSRQALTTERRPLRDVAFSASGDRAVVVDEAGEVSTFHVASGQPLMRFAVEGSSPVEIAFDAENRVTIALADGTLRTFESVPVWRLERTIGAPDSTAAFVDRVAALEFDPSGTLLATGGGEPSRSGELKLWNVETGELVRDFAGAHSDTVFDVSFSGDGSQLASCGADRFVKTFDVAKGEPLRSFEGHTHHVLSVDWRADDRLLATGSADLAIKIWDVKLGEQIRTIQNLPKEANSLRFLGATDDFAVAVGDAQVVNRNVGGGTGAAYTTPSDFVYVVRSTGDGKFVLAGGQDGTLRVWDRTGKPVAEFPPDAADIEPAAGAAGSGP